MGSARIFTITQLRGGARNPFDLRWFLGIVVTSLVIVGVAGLVAWVASDRSLFIGGLSGLVMGVFGALLLLLISPLIFLMEHLAGAMPQASGAMQSVIDALDELRATFGTIANNLFGLFDIPSLLDWMQLLKPFLLWGFVVVIALAILFSISRWLINERRTEMDEHEGIIERGDVLSLLRKAIQALSVTPPAQPVLDSPDIDAIYCAVPHHLHERIYTAARRKGVIFLRYEPEAGPRVEKKGDVLEVGLPEPSIGREVTLEPDLLVHSAQHHLVESEEPYLDRYLVFHASPSIRCSTSLRP